MRMIDKIQDMQEFSREMRRNGKTVGLVPTMGFLHEGHLSLVDIAKSQTDVVVVTIFVNPTQFGPNEDLDAYPRDFERDCQLCKERGVTAIFAPGNDEMYPPDSSVWVTEEQLSKVLCGKSRPIHFRGVTTVVTKLFNAVLPDVAVFGRKDAQQALILKRMVRDLNFPIQIVVGPIIREPDGLALSSRNKYLNEDERKRAVVISQALFAAQDKVSTDNSKNPDKIIKEIKDKITAAGGETDYVEARYTSNLETATDFTRPVLIAAAAKFGPARLIDNIMIGKETDLS